MPHISCTANDRAGYVYLSAACLSADATARLAAQTVAPDTAARIPPRCAAPHPLHFAPACYAAPAPHPHLYERLLSRPDAPAQRRRRATRHGPRGARLCTSRSEKNFRWAVQCNCAVQSRGSAVQRRAASGAWRWRWRLSSVAPWPHRSGCPWRCLSAVRGAAVCGLVPPLRAAEAISLYKIRLLSYCVSGVLSAPLLLTRFADKVYSYSVLCI